LDADYLSFSFCYSEDFSVGPDYQWSEKSEDRIRKDLERAESAWKEAEAKANALSLRLEEAKAEALAILEEGRADALKLRNKLMEEAQHESDLIRERTKNDIGLAKQQALKEIWEQTALLSTQIASKIISKELSVEDHQDLVQSYLADYQKLSV
jgi:F-type H+-transporting ATPase subunit b